VGDRGPGSQGGGYQGCFGEFGFGRAGFLGTTRVDFNAVRVFGGERNGDGD
jgi:hypothetical protein